MTSLEDGITEDDFVIDMDETNWYLMIKVRDEKKLEPLKKSILNANKTSNDIKNWIEQLKKSDNRVLPHNSFDSGCCEGKNDSLRFALIGKLESLIK